MKHCVYFTSTSAAVFGVLERIDAMVDLVRLQRAGEMERRGRGHADGKNTESNSTAARGLQLIKSLQRVVDCS